MKEITGSQTKFNISALRKLLGCTMIGLCLLFVVGDALARTHKPPQETADSVPIKLRTALHQEIEIHATPQRVYDALLTSKQFTAFTTAPADIKATQGGALSMFGGMVTGRNIELVNDSRIVQAWRPGSWPAGVYSIVKFELKAQGQNTLVILDHTGFPQGDYESLSGGWESHYWKPMQKYFP